MLEEVLLDEDSYQEYNHGEIDRHEAEERLTGKVEGTFLLRVSDGGLRLCRVPHTSGNQIRHFIVHKDRHDSYYLTSKLKFPSVEELIGYYQNVDNMVKYWLGEPLYTQKALDKVHNKFKILLMNLLPTYNKII